RIHRMSSMEPVSQSYGTGPYTGATPDRPPPQPDTRRSSARLAAQFRLQFGDLLFHRLAQGRALVRLHRRETLLERVELGALLARVALDRAVVGLLSLEGAHRLLSRFARRGPYGDGRRRSSAACAGAPKL